MAKKINNQNSDQKEQPKQYVLVGDNTEVLKTFPDNYFDSIVTDAPYGLGKEPNVEEMLQAWITHGYLEVKGTGFMGKKWDAFVPQPIFWKEVYRVLKHGGHVISFFGTRTADWGSMAIRLGGFEIRDQITWLYGSGFPKSMDISKQIDKMAGAEREVISEKFKGNKAGKKSGIMGETVPRTDIKSAPSTEEAKQWEGWGTALKPAQEIIILARKPMEKGLNVAQNILKWGVGGLNIDVSRIASSEQIMNHSRGSDSAVSKGKYGDSKAQETHQTEGQKNGRFPSNVIFSHHPQCECIGYKRVKGSNCNPESIGKGREGDHTNGIYGAKSSKITVSHTDADGMELVEDWKCHDECPIKMLDEQSGVSKSSDTKRTRNTIGSFGMPNDETPEYSDEGGASRFFYVAKASKSERNFGLGNFEDKQGGSLNFRNPASSGRSADAPSVEAMGGITAPTKNFHPTVKPIKLMQYLVRLVTPEGGKVLDPFAGSGTTGCACKIDGFECVLIDITPEYAPITQARIDAFVEEREIIDNCKIFDSIKDVIPNQLNLFEEL